MRRVLLVITLFATMALAPARASASDVDMYHETVTGLAEIYVSDCPWDAPPTDLAICNDAMVLYYQPGQPGEPARREPWRAVVYQMQGRFHAEIDDFEVLWERWGVSTEVAGHVDTQHLSGAYVRGSVPMSDGATVEVNLTWDMTGQPIVVDGMDGPIEEGTVPWGTTYADRCLTQNYLAHQRWRGDGAITGTIGDIDVADMLPAPRDPFIEGQSVFTKVITEHGPACPES